jgi:quercetin dioxygenase-like cupin family protein
MKIFRAEQKPWQPGDPNTFTGNVVTKRLAEDSAGIPVTVYHVEFNAGARTNWHRHSGPQWLLIVEGRVRIQKWGEGIEEVGVGDAIAIAPGEKHWHGATPGSHGAHFAVNVNATTEWLEPVSDEQYRSPI